MHDTFIDRSACRRNITSTREFRVRVATACRIRGPTATDNALRRLVQPLTAAVARVHSLRVVESETGLTVMMVALWQYPFDRVLPRATVAVLAAVALYRPTILAVSL